MNHWEQWPNFNADEFACSHTGKNEMDPDFMEKLQLLRTYCGFPFVITSGYRDPSHPIEAKKAKPGTHSQGIAVDIAVFSNHAYRILAAAPKFGFTGIGVSQRAGHPRFIHLDTRTTSPTLYSY